MGIKKGQKVWINLARGGLTETTMKSVGRKYITTEYDYRITFDVNTLRQVNYYGIPHSIILDLEKHKKDCHYNYIIKTLNRFTFDTLEREDLDRIYEIINKGGNINE